ncbi:hypothetical protein [Luteimonas mephitis]|uniref:hypothetical protein n=1 Tax=Luteimonas mephitis TaxID=83615 RepID=UPI0004277A53|nr:hypothetical protein [Luteimonas mephitis]
MSQNRIDIELSTEALAAVDGALGVLEEHLAPLVGLSPDERKGLSRMGDKSEAFCRQAVVAFTENPDVLPRNFDLDAYRRDLAMLDALRPRLSKMGRLFERMQDTETALGSDLMANSLEGYAVLKVSGKGAGLESLRQMLSARFARSPRPAAAPPAPAPTPTPESSP